jgi:hypothetical protein
MTLKETKNRSPSIVGLYRRVLKGYGARKIFKAYEVFENI